MRTTEGCCAVCGKTLLTDEAAFGTAAPVCHGCRTRRPAFDLARSAAAFQGPVRQLVHGLKYRHGFRLAEPLAELLHGCFLAHFAAERPDLVCAVPLHRARRRRRGYNQSELLARLLARRLALPFAPGLLRRVRDTPTQTRMDARQRRDNMAGAFRVPESACEKLAGSDMLLVDDVVTTGSTADACARALKDAGARKVSVLCFASTARAFSEYEAE